MAVKKSPGITATMIKFGGGIGAARAFPKAKGKRPAVIILHERYGVDQHTKDLTARLAQAGFVGLAPDLFHRFTGDRKAVLRGEQRVDLTDDGALEDLNAAVDYLKRLKQVDGSADRHHRRLPNRPSAAAAGGQAQRHRRCRGPLRRGRWP